MKEPTFLIAKTGIIIPVYHAEKFIQKCLDSLYVQTCKDFHVYLVIDDISFDKTLDIVHNHNLYRDNLVTCLTSDRKTSPAIARNRGCLYAHNHKYIMFMDVDDVWEYDKVERQTEYMEKNPCIDVSFTGGWWHRDFGTYMLGKLDTSRMFKSGMFIWSSSMFRQTALRRVINRRNYLFDTRWKQCDDSELLIYMADMGMKFGYLDVPLVHMHEHGGNLTQGNLWEPNYWAAKSWMEHGHVLLACKHVMLGVLAVLTEYLHVRHVARQWRMKFNHMTRT